ncbi:DMT family transporter [Flavisphingopyxis soli]|nr:DMT family transporter [Sphingorhabdus soli]
MSSTASKPLIAFAVAVVAIGSLSAMDAAMKGLVIALGTWPTMLWRSVLAIAVIAPIYLLLRARWPTRRALRFHIIRGVLVVPMSVLFFWGLARVPMAQAIALSFIAPLIAQWLAAVLLGETMGPRTLAGSLLASAGVAVIFTGQAKADLGVDALKGSIAIIGSAFFYAYNIVLMRQQALAAKPLEIAFFQFAVTGAAFWLLTPLIGLPPLPQGHWGALAIAALLSMSGMLLLAWAYARAGAGYLSASEYSGFAWATLFGWLVFGERVSPFTLAGATLILAGCWIAARAHSERPDAAPVAPDMIPPQAEAAHDA